MTMLEASDLSQVYKDGSSLPVSSLPKADHAPIEFEHVTIPTPPNKVLTLDAKAMREGQRKLDKEAVTELLNVVQAELERKIKTPDRRVNVYLEDFDLSLQELQTIQWAIEEQGYQVRYSSKNEAFHIRW